MITEQPSEQLLCRLQPNVGLYMQQEFFILKIDDKKYYYDWIGSALKAFIIWSLKRYQKVNCSDSVAALIKSIEDLDTTLANAESVLSDEWRECLQDPIEQACRGEDNDNEDN
jgi:hypothetical protein